MATYLVPGANRGIGYEYCRQLQARGDTAIAVCRETTKQLKALKVRVEENIDVTSDDSVADLLPRLEATITENLTRAEALPQSILKQAFAGKLVPQDPNDEPEQLIERIRQEKRQQTNGKQLELKVFVEVENR